MCDTQNKKITRNQLLISQFYYLIVLLLVPCKLQLQGVGTHTITKTKFFLLLMKTQNHSHLSLKTWTIWLISFMPCQLLALPIVTSWGGRSNLHEDASIGGNETTGGSANTKKKHGTLSSNLSVADTNVLLDSSVVSRGHNVRPRRAVSSVPVPEFGATKVKFDRQDETKTETSDCNHYALGILSKSPEKYSAVCCYALGKGRMFCVQTGCDINHKGGLTKSNRVQFMLPKSQV